MQTLSRELILPALRLDVPSRPTGEHLTLLAQRSADEWTLDARQWTTHQVVRLAVAAVLEARLGQADPERLERGGLSGDPDQVTMGGLASLFRPHVDLLAQAFRVAVVEAVNAGVPAAADPLREGLRRTGVTGRDAVRVVALGLDKVPARARSEFWKAARGSIGVTAVVDALAGGSGGHDVSTLDRSHLSRADALVQAGGRTVPVALGQRAREDGGSWLKVPLGVTRGGTPAAGPGGPGSAPGSGGRAQPGGGVEVALRGEGWSEVFDVTLDAVTAAMHHLDLGNRPKSRPSGLAGALADRLAAAKDRTVAEVCASLRDVHPLVAEAFGPQVAVSTVRVAVPVVEDDQFMQLWLPTSALAGPLVTGAVDLFLGAGSDVRGPAGPGGSGSGGPGSGGPGGSGRGRAAQSGQGRRSGGSGRQPGQGQPRQPGQGQPGQPGQPGQTPSEGGGKRRGRKGRGRRTASEPGATAPGEAPVAPPAEPAAAPSSEAPAAPPAEPPATPPTTPPTPPPAD